MKKLAPVFILCVFFAIHVQAAEIMQDTEVIAKARVKEIISQEERVTPGTNIRSTYQQLRVEILEGKEQGSIVVADNDYTPLQKDEILYLDHTTHADNGHDSYFVADSYRLPSLYFLIGLFICILCVFGGIQGIRGFISLLASLLVIFYVLLPQLSHGSSPLFVSIGVASLIIIINSYITHGFNKTTSSAVIGMCITILGIGFLTYYEVAAAHLTGFSSDETTYLNFSTAGHINLVGLLLGGIMIGFLGVLYDIAIGQAIAVEELWSTAPHLSRATIYKKAMRIGREHIGAIVNTLAIAYVGTALPLLLLFYSSQTAPLLIINREIFATEIIRIIIGGIGIIIAVPITTFVATALLAKKS